MRQESSIRNLAEVPTRDKGWTGKVESRLTGRHEALGG